MLPASSTPGYLVIGPFGNEPGRGIWTALAADGADGVRRGSGWWRHPLRPGNLYASAMAGTAKEPAGDRSLNRDAPPPGRGRHGGQAHSDRVRHAGRGGTG